jgi:hypothetical protein
MDGYRVRWEPEEDITPAQSFDSSVHDIAKLNHQIDDGEQLWMRAIVEKRCGACDAWHPVDYLGGVMAPPGDPYWEMVENELLSDQEKSTPYTIARDGLAAFLVAACGGTPTHVDVYDELRFVAAVALVERRGAALIIASAPERMVKVGCSDGGTELPFDTATWTIIAGAEEKIGLPPLEADHYLIPEA